MAVKSTMKPADITVTNKLFKVNLMIGTASNTCLKFVKSNLVGQKLGGSRKDSFAFLIDVPSIQPMGISI